MLCAFYNLVMPWQLQEWGIFMGDKNDLGGIDAFTGTLKPGLMGLLHEGTPCIARNLWGVDFFGCWGWQSKYCLILIQSTWSYLCRNLEYGAQKPEVQSNETTMQSCHGTWAFDTLRPRQNDLRYLDDIVEWVFLKANVDILFQIPLLLVPKG